MAYAMIGRPPGTFDARTISIELHRATASEWKGLRPVAEIEEYLHALARQAARWAKNNLGSLKTAKPAMGVASNRDADNWRPLFAIADLVGNGWGKRARQAAERVLALVDNRSYGEMVLLDIKAIIDASTANEFPSAEIVDRLVDLPGRPWAEFGRKQKPITQTALAALLTPFKIVTVKVGRKNKRLNGYTRQQFEDAFKRYLPAPPLSDQTPGQNAMDADQPARSHPDTGVQFETGQNPNNGGLASGCPVSQGECKEEDDDLDIPSFLRRVA